jgi:hypothetical protein
MHAQSNYGAVRGSIADASGAVLANASVTLVNSATKLERATKSNGAGEYVFNAVEPGVYSVKVSESGFSDVIQNKVTVDAGNTIPVDVKMSIGGSSTVVEVTSAEPVVDNGTSYGGQLIDSQKLLNLPNPGRNPFLFSKLDNSVTPVGDPRFTRFQDQSGSSQISIAGAPISSNNYLIDGIPITDFSNRAVIIPSLDATDNVKVQANTYDAEIGRTSGGNFNTTLRSGSSRFHGALQGATRQTNWGANLWFNNRNGQPRSAAEYYTYVGSLGGPIPTPGWKWLGGSSSKTFFQITEEGYRQRSPVTQTQSFPVPTAKMRTGDFSELLASGRIIYNPYSSRVDPVTKKVVRDPYAGNIIPTAQINKVGQALLNAYPNPNAAFTGIGSLNFVGGDTLGDRADEFIGKLDHNFGSRWLADFYYMHYGSKEPGGNALQSAAGSSSSYQLFRKVDAVGIQNTITVTPTTILTVGFGFNRFPNDTQDISKGFDQTSLGLPTSYVSALAKTGFPAITTSSANNLAFEGTSNSGPGIYFSRNFVVGVAKSLGKHSLKTGYVYRKISYTYTSLSNGSGTFGFDTSFTSLDNTTTAASGGADAASILLGLPASGTVNLPSQLAITVPYHAVYLQDDYRVTSKITLNFGLRYEYEPGVHDRNNNYAVGFDRTVTNPLTATSGVQTPGGVQFAGQNGYGTSTGNMGSKWAPRGGIAVQVAPNTVLKGGIGLFFPPIVYSGLQTPGYTGVNSYATNSVNGQPGTNLSNPYPNGLVRPSGNSQGYLTGVGGTLSLIDQGRKAPSFTSYSLDLEHQLPTGIALKIAYVGGHGNNLTNSINLNQLADSNYALGTAALNTNVTNPYYQKGGAQAIGNATVARYQLLRPFAAFGTITDSVSNGVSDYNSLQVKVQKRFASGLTVLTAYTWSSNWDNLYGAGSSLNSGNNGPQSIYNLSSEYSRAINNIPNRFTAAVTYELPFGHGKMFLGGANRLVDMVVGGWKFNDIMIVQNGGPLSITQANGNSSYGNSSQRPTIVPGVNPCKTGRPEDRLTSYFNTAAFTATPAGSYGNSSRTINCQGPGYLNSDLSLNKNFRVAEGVNAEFRAEAMNAFNTPQFATPNLTVGNAAAGQISGTLGFPRLVQLGGRITF